MLSKGIKNKPSGLSVVLICFFLLVFSFGCATTKQITQQEQIEERLTLGLVQKNVKKGMSQAEVARVLGSPNIVTTDRDGSETWIYDKVAVEARSKSVSGGVGGGIMAYPGATVFGGGGGVSGSKSEYASTERTLTVVIKFDKQNRVSDVSYHASKF